MKTLELNQMEALNGAQSGRGCLIAGGVALVGVLICPFTSGLGCLLAFEVGIDAAGEGCFNT